MKPLLQSFPENTLLTTRLLPPLCKRRTWGWGPRQGLWGLWGLCPWLYHWGHTHSHSWWHHGLSSRRWDATIHQLGPASQRLLCLRDTHGGEKHTQSLQQSPTWKSQSGPENSRTSPSQLSRAWPTFRKTGPGHSLSPGRWRASPRSISNLHPQVLQVVGWRWFPEARAQAAPSVRCAGRRPHHPPPLQRPCLDSHQRPLLGTEWSSGWEGNGPNWSQWGHLNTTVKLNRENYYCMAAPWGSLEGSWGAELQATHLVTMGNTASENRSD